MPELKPEAHVKLPHARVCNKAGRWGVNSQSEALASLSDKKGFFKNYSSEHAILLATRYDKGA